MVLAELIAAAGLIDEGQGAGDGARDTGPAQLSGLKLVDGMARGHAVYPPAARRDRAHRRRGHRGRAPARLCRLRQMREQIDRMTSQAEFGVGGEHQDVLETYKMFAYDEGWSRRINEAIDSGLTAEAAIERVQQRTRMRMREIDDPLLRDRMHDLEDLSNRLLRIVSGQLGTAAQLGLRQDTILIARNLGPAELLEYDRRRLKGVVLEEGSLDRARHHRRARDGRAGARPRRATCGSWSAEGDLLLLDATQRHRDRAPDRRRWRRRSRPSCRVRQKRRAEFAALARSAGR